MVSYYRPTVTLCLKCTVFEIWRHIGRKSPKNPTHPHLARSFGVTPCKFFDESYLARNAVLLLVYLHDYVIRRGIGSNRMPQCYWSPCWIRKRSCSRGNAFILHSEEEWLLLWFIKLETSDHWNYICVCVAVISLCRYSWGSLEREHQTTVGW